MDKYKEALIRILDIDLGIFPESVHTQSGKGGYKKRTLYMDGWNAASIAHAGEIVMIFKELGIDTSDWPEPPPGPE